MPFPASVRLLKVKAIHRGNAEEGRIFERAGRELISLLVHQTTRSNADPLVSYLPNRYRGNDLVTLVFQRLDSVCDDCGQGLCHLPARPGVVLFFLQLLLQHFFNQLFHRLDLKLSVGLHFVCIFQRCARPP